MLIPGLEVFEKFITVNNTFAIGEGEKIPNTRRPPPCLDRLISLSESR